MRSERLAETCSGSFSMDQEDLEFILRAKGSNMLRSGFQKDPFGCNMEDRLEECKWGGRTMLSLLVCFRWEVIIRSRGCNQGGWMS